MSDKHLMHYKKVKVEKGISLRFFYTFEDKHQFEGKWILTMDKRELYSPFSMEGIEVLNMLHDFDLNNYTEIREVIENNICYKTVIKAKGKTKTSSKKIVVKEKMGL